MTRRSKYDTNQPLDVQAVRDSIEHVVNMVAYQRKVREWTQLINGGQIPITTPPPTKPEHPSVIRGSF